MLLRLVPLEMPLDGGNRLQVLEQKVETMNQRMEAFMHEHSAKLSQLGQIMDLLQRGLPVQSS